MHKTINPIQVNPISEINTNIKVNPTDKVETTLDVLGTKEATNEAKKSLLNTPANLFHHQDNAKPVFIWDVGGVILDWNPKQFAKTYQSGKYEKNCLAIFESENWKKFDKGDLTYSDMLAIYVKQFELSEKIVDDMIQSAFHSLKPVWPVIEFIKALQAEGYEQYCLTNGSKEYFNHVRGEKFKQAYNFSLNDLFDDKHIILSANINMMKPDPKIYQYTENAFSLGNRKKVFADDNEDNANMARKLGWMAIHFKNLEDCKEKMKNLNIDLNTGLDTRCEAKYF